MLLRLNPREWKHPTFDGDVPDPSGRLWWWSCGRCAAAGDSLCGRNQQRCDVADFGAVHGTRTGICLVCLDFYAFLMWYF